MRFESWEDYWRRYDALCDALEQEGRTTVVAELRDAQGCVNGLTDGWHDFHDALEGVRRRNRFTPDQAATLEDLLAGVASALRRR